MQLSEELIADLEVEYLNIVIKLLNNGELTVEQAKESAIFYLSLLPYADFVDLQAKVNKFLEKYPWSAGMNILLMRKQEQFKTKDVLEKMRNLMHSNKIDEALQVAKPQ